MSSPWLTVVGIGEDGLDGLAPSLRAIVETAEVLIGGRRHLAMVPKGGEIRVAWSRDFTGAAKRIGRFRGRRTVVLASGDPMDYGAGAVLARNFSPDEMVVFPAPGSVALACARLGWSRQEVEVVTVHGRPLETLNLHLLPGARLLVLSRDGDSPAEIAALLRERGFGPSRISVLERLGSPNEKIASGTAARWRRKRGADLNLVALEVLAGKGARSLSRTPGLPDDAFRHDGQITKREVRAVTLSALAPLPGETLWDLGAGSGSVAIEWLRAEPRASAIAVERRADRLANIAHNAACLGVPRLGIVGGEAPKVFPKLGSAPDAIFVGGGVGRTRFLDVCWKRLASGGRLVANGVTLEAEERLIAARNRFGGDLVRIEISRFGGIGPMTRLSPMMPVLQWRAVKG